MWQGILDKSVLLPNYRNTGVQNGRTNLLMPGLWPWPYMCAVCRLLQKLWTWRAQVLENWRLTESSQFLNWEIKLNTHCSSVGTKWARVWEVGIVIVETQRRGKSTHTVLLMFWAPRWWHISRQLWPIQIIKGWEQRPLGKGASWHSTASEVKDFIRFSIISHSKKKFSQTYIAPTSMSLWRHVFTGVLKYAYELLTLDTFMKLPGDLQVRMKFNLLLRDSTVQWMKAWELED